jgi:transcription initiation factor TFIID subunit TAF12
LTDLLALQWTSKQTRVSGNVWKKAIKTANEENSEKDKKHWRPDLRRHIAGGHEAMMYRYVNGTEPPDDLKQKFEEMFVRQQFVQRYTDTLFDLWKRIKIYKKDFESFTVPELKTFLKERRKTLNVLIECS